MKKKCYCLRSSLGSRLLMVVRDHSRVMKLAGSAGHVTQLLLDRRDPLTGIRLLRLRRRSTVPADVAERCCCPVE